MRVTEQLVRRSVYGLLGGVVWVVALLGALEGSDYLAAGAIGNLVTVMTVARWSKARGVAIWAAAFVGSLGLAGIWDALPWHSKHVDENVLLLVPLSFASVALWWALRGYRYAPPAVARPAKGLAERVAIAGLLGVLALIAYVFIRAFFR